MNVPIDGTLDETLEEPAYNTDELRLKYYGQCDHVRKYGRDYPVSVTGVAVEEYSSPDEIERYGLSRQEWIFACRK